MHFIKISLTKLFLISFVFSCTGLPQAEFYETDGIVSIEAKNLREHSAWSKELYHTTYSKISLADTSSARGGLPVTFYVSRPGEYALWVLSAKNTLSDEEGIPFQVEGEDGFLIHSGELELPPAKDLEWVNRDRRTGSRIMFGIEEPGFVTLTFDPGGRAGFVIGKLHISLDNLEKPSGMGLPETNRPGLDPLLAKRDQVTVIPPSWMFEPFCSDVPDDGDQIYLPEYIGAASSAGCSEVTFSAYSSDAGTEGWSSEDNNRQLAEAFRRAQADSGDSVFRGAIFAPAVNLYHPEFTMYPTLWTAHVESTPDEELEMLTNPRRTTYEIPYMVSVPRGIFEGSGDHFSEELFIRWVQFSAFSTTMFIPLQEQTVKEHLTDVGFERYQNLIQLRRKLFPYVYSHAHLTRSTAQKPVRGDEGHPAQFQFGEAFLVAPVFDEEADRRMVYLPAGTWYSYQRGTEFEGGQSWIVEVSPDELPVWVKAGSVVPYRMPENKDGELSDPNRRLRLDVYGGSSGTFRLYEDDGKTTGYQRGEFSTTAFRYFEGDGYSTFTIGRMVRGYAGQADEKEFEIHFRYIPKPEQITAEGELLEEDREWFYDDENKAVVLNWIQPNNRKTDFRIVF